MKVLIILLAGVVFILSAFILIPTPTIALLPLTIAVAEFSPWLLVFNLLVAAVAARYYKPALPFVAAAFLVSGWPLLQVHSVAKDESTASVLLACLRSMHSTPVQPQRLPLNMLYYPPSQGSGLHPAFIDIYGGAWHSGAPGQTYRLDSYLAQRGFAVFAIDYRHAPAFRFPAQLDDVKAALLFLRQHAAQYNIDPLSFVLCGHSSGAHLALLAAYEEAAVPVRGVISYYGPTDLTRGYFDPPVPDPLNVRAVLETFLGGSPAQLSKLYNDASPVSHVRPSLPPTLLIHGERDHLVKAEFSRELYERIKSTGNSAYLVQLPWSEHAFDFAFSGLGNQVSLPYLDRFLKNVVGDGHFRLVSPQ